MKIRILAEYSVIFHEPPFIADFTWEEMVMTPDVGWDPLIHTNINLQYVIRKQQSSTIMTLSITTLLPSWQYIWTYFGYNHCIAWFFYTLFPSITSTFLLWEQKAILAFAFVVITYYYILLHHAKININKYCTNHGHSER